MILPLGMGSFLKRFKSQIEIINKIHVWRNMYFSAIQNVGNICENSYSWPIVMQISTKPIKCGIILYNI